MVVPALYLRVVAPSSDHKAGRACVAVLQGRAFSKILHGSSSARCIVQYMGCLAWLCDLLVPLWKVIEGIALHYVQ